MEGSMSEQGDAGPIYTDKQKEYVGGVKDEHLRDHLLHQVRLRDIMEEDRDKASARADKYMNQVIELRVKLRECCPIIGIKTD
jgi:hypothetical protein